MSIDIHIPKGAMEPQDPTGARYDLTPMEMGQLSSELFAQQPPQYQTEYACYRFEGDSLYANLGRTLEQQIFNEAFPEHPHTPEEMHKEYGPYEPASTFLISFDTKTQKPVGVIRVIKNSEAGLKSVNDLAEPDVEGARDWTLDADRFATDYGIESMDDLQDIGTLGVLKEYRSSSMAISAQLYRALYVSIMDKQDGARHGISIIDEKTIGQLKKYMGLPMLRIKGTEPFSYLGSNAEATYSRPDEYRDAVRRKRAALKVGVPLLSAMAKVSGLENSRKQAQRAKMLLGILDQFIDGNDDTPVVDGSLQFETDIR